MKPETEIALNLITEYNSGEVSPISVKTNEPMSKHTSFRIGGNCELYVTPSDVKGLQTVLKAIKESRAKYYVLGNGSNVVFPDEGYDGVVVSLSDLNTIEVKGNKIICGAGASLTAAAKAAQANSLTGLEFAYGIPGSVGGAVYMNAGAYGGQMADVVYKSSYVNVGSNSIGELVDLEHRFSYRESIYKNYSHMIITGAEFLLQKGDKSSITEKMDDLMNRRITKQPLDYPSAGSVFKRYEGKIISQLIDEAGLKGYSIGGAQVSKKHAGFIVNTGDATAEDVKNLVSHIQKVLTEKYSVTPECEIIFVK